MHKGSTVSSYKISEAESAKFNKLRHRKQAASLQYC